MPLYASKNPTPTTSEAKRSKTTYLSQNLSRGAELQSSARPFPASTCARGFRSWASTCVRSALERMCALARSSRVGPPSGAICLTRSPCEQGLSEYSTLPAFEHLYMFCAPVVVAVNSITYRMLRIADPPGGRQPMVTGVAIAAMESRKPPLGGKVSQECQDDAQRTSKRHARLLAERLRIAVHRQSVAGDVGAGRRGEEDDSVRDVVRADEATQ